MQKKASRTKKEIGIIAETPIPPLSLRVKVFVSPTQTHTTCQSSLQIR